MHFLIIYAFMRQRDIRYQLYRSHKDIIDTNWFMPPLRRGKETFKGTRPYLTVKPRGTRAQKWNICRWIWISRSCTPRSLWTCVKRAVDNLATISRGEDDDRERTRRFNRSAGWARTRNTIIYIRVRDYSRPRGRYCFSDWANIILGLPSFSSPPYSHYLRPVTITCFSDNCETL